MKKILLITYFPDISIGGIERLFGDIYFSLNKLGYQQKILSINKAKTNDLLTKDYDVLLRGNKYMIVGIYNLRDLLIFIYLLFNGSNKIIIISHIYLSRGALLYAKMFNNKIIVYAHGREVWQEYRESYKRVLRRAEIWTNSSFTKNIIKDRTVFTKILNPIVSDEILKKGVKTPKGLTTFPIKLLIVGRVDHEYKGHKLVISATERLIKSGLNISLDIIGTGKMSTEIENIVENSSANSHIQYYGYVSKSVLLERYNSANVFVLPSKFSNDNNDSTGEGFGIVYLEAMNFGLPVIAYKKGGHIDFIKDGYNGKLVEYDIESLSKAIRKIISSEKKYVDYSKHAINTAKKFNQGIMINTLKHLLMVDTKFK